MDAVEVLVEIPRGSRNKYEWDYERKMLRLDRTLYSSVHYPADYGCISETYAEDGDHLDALILVEEPSVPARLVGGLKRTWKRIIRDAGVGHVRFHDLRHASATYLLQAGVPVQMVSQRLGHSRTSTTTDIYAHVLPGMGRAAADALENVMVTRWSKSKDG